MSSIKRLEYIQGKDTGWVSENINKITEQTDFCALCGLAKFGG